ncbi:DoxX family protein [Flectobacillus sp. DC10W]|uniref:DoxX family protein n=1 Tax=Flectobacillus longus TaxID=2984207 RepID=A0ABT6YHT0_9BACT|nr:DoxX family protein [Flectobacillus longus]MDI9862974.1 DoxX family protein [Flectobacillus longus]
MTTHKHNSKFKTLTAWVLQSLLALSLAYGGVMKLTIPIDQLAQMWPWVVQVPTIVVWGTAILDLLGAIGIVLPSLLCIKPQISRWAAFGILLLMLSAIVFHLVRGEATVIGFNIFMIVLTLILLRLWKS